MNKINYIERIDLKDTINELLLINIDEKLIKSNESDCIKIGGEIEISGEASTLKGRQTFNHSLNVDIMLSKEQIISEDILITVDDFNYKLDSNYIEITIIMKIDGLKEIDAYFPSQEDQENLEVIDNEIEAKEDYDSIDDTDFSIDIRDTQDIEIPTQTLEKKENYSLLKQVFKNKTLKSDTCYLFHVVKKETTYKEIADIYNLDESLLKASNNDEEIYPGKLISIPKI